jgi:large repetitive protein
MPIQKPEARNGPHTTARRMTVALVIAGAALLLTPLHALAATNPTPTSASGQPSSGTAQATAAASYASPSGTTLASGAAAASPSSSGAAVAPAAGGASPSSSRAALAPAAGAGDPSSSGTTQANVDVASVIALTSLTPSFDLTGLPGDTITGDDAVTMDVLTNNATGYNVTVESLDASLFGPAAATIPIADLTVDDDAAAGGTTGYLPLSDTAPVTVFTSPSPSSLTGDVVSNNYQITIPAVTTGTYSATLSYVASTNP